MRLESARARATHYLTRCQREDGAWVPLWFGNQHEPSLENPLYGTSRVLKAHAAGDATDPAWTTSVRRAIAWTIAAQHSDGGWGGAAGLPPSVEETALAVEALACVASRDPAPELIAAVERGASWLARTTRSGARFDASPIGLYFAKLWYSERLYPLVFTVAALERARPVVGSGGPGVEASRASAVG